MRILPRVRTCHSLRDLEDGVDQYGISSGWLWRGQADARWSLATALERAVPDPGRRRESEEHSFAAFRKSAHLYENLLVFGNLVGERPNDFWLSFMQHHGVPTRFLDFTESLYIAAYFALERVPASATCAAVWALNAKAFNNQSDAVYRGHDASSGMGPNEFNFGHHQNPHLVIWPQRDIGYTRLLEQQGHGMIPLRADASFEECLAGSCLGLSNCIVRFEIPLAFRKGILSQLYTMNITRETLFPGLQGLGERIGVALESGILKSR